MIITKDKGYGGKYGKIVDFIITKIEPHIKNDTKKELIREILDSIDKYKKIKYDITTIRYYRIKTFKVDDIV